ncbi:MAG: hypothetical protein QW735_03660 [archaeon]
MREKRGDFEIERVSGNSRITLAEERRDMTEIKRNVAISDVREITEKAIADLMDFADKHEDREVFLQGARLRITLKKNGFFSRPTAELGIEEPDIRIGRKKEEKDNE